ncbi:eCIS core domain-containing protein [Solimicrobium silvestre]|uniref:eCIS core domain-containing protein n=1 Tax=Solimicrobium silvestre TaxID=2099400 RepID=A0A2S9H0G1_9BURK|nr:DUF4157 domain-containing protein [Solimicrobium silvestre]PRC93457.1 hypothetical protein S2091_1844 [Solimicrobium silvestre]
MSTATPLQPVKTETQQQHSSLSPQSTQLAPQADSKFIDNRPQTTALTIANTNINNSAQAKQLRAFSQIAQTAPRAKQFKAMSAMMNTPALKRVEEEETLQAKSMLENPAQRSEQGAPKPNNTGLPDNLKSGIESLSGMNIDHVKVHYNSPQPAQLNAHAYAQGSEIHVAPGQEQHLPHEAWHVVQQAQGRVKPTMQMKGGVPVNDDAGLEKEADVMGSKALQFKENHPAPGPVFQNQAAATGISSIQYVRKNQTDLIALTVGAFDAHRKAEQMDWANEAGFSKNDRETIWDILDWGTGGLAAFTLSDIITKAKKGTPEFNFLNIYCQSINGAVDGKPTIQLESLLDIDDAIKQGKWLSTLQATIGNDSHLKSTIPLDAFIQLIETETIATAFINYYTTCNPILETPTGDEVKAFVTLVKVEGAKISDYKTDLPDIRNLHKFEKASLDKLKADKGNKTKPLTLVLLSLFDHNGAFIRHAHVNKVIQNTNTNAYAIEGADEGKLTNLKDAGLAQIALTHGKDGKITQIMVAGHGSSKSIEVGGEKTVSGKSVKTGADVTIPDYKTKFDLEFDTKKGSFWTDFFAQAFDNMEAKDGLSPKILLRACLTGSNEIDLEKLKIVLVTEKGLDLTSADPTTDINQTKIRLAIKEQYEKHGSLVSVLGDKAKGKGITILGAQASISARETESVVPATGELGVIPATGIPLAQQDPHVAGTKINYVRSGKEPTGVIKAVIESWAIDKDDCFLKMAERVTDPVGTDDEFTIQLIFKTISAQYTKNILEANKFVNTAGNLHGIAEGRAECRASTLANDAMTQTHQSDFYPALLTKFKNQFAKLVIYEDWMQKDTSKRADFVDQLSNPAFTRTNVEKYLEAKLLDAHFSSIFTGSLGNERGRILLGLFGFIKNGQADCKTYLLTQKDVDGKLLATLTDELNGYNEDLLRGSLGLPVEAAPKIGGGGGILGAAPKAQKNIDVVSAFYVSPMRPTNYESNTVGSVRIRSGPAHNSPELESFFKNRTFIVVGEVKRIADDTSVGRYMVKQDAGTVGYVSKDAVKVKK